MTSLKDMFKSLIDALEKEGYKVNIGPQEHLKLEKEIALDLEDVVLTLESPSSYVVELRVVIGMIAKDRLSLLEQIDSILPIIDKAINWKIDDVVISVEGELIMATIMVLMREVMSV